LASVVVSCVTKAANPLNDWMEAAVFVLVAPAPTENTGENKGRPLAAGAAAAAALG